MAWFFFLKYDKLVGITEELGRISDMTKKEIGK